MSAVENQAGEGMSKSAKRRAAKKARDATAGEEAEAPAPAAPPAPEPKAKAKAKAKAEPAPAAAAPAAAPKAEAKAKAKGKAKAKAEPEPPAPAPKAEAAPKAKAKGKAKAEPEPPAAAAPKAKAAAKAEPAAKAAAKAEPKAAAAAPKAAAGKAKAKAAAAKVEEEEKPKESVELGPNYVIDDGSGPAWEVNTGLTKKQQKQKERKDQQKAGPVITGKPVPGMAPTNTIPGMAPAKADGKGASQSVAADVERILAMKQAGAAVEEKPPEGSVSTATIRVPEPKIGIVIGPKGAKIKMIQEKTGVARIDTTGEVFTIMGPPPAVAQAETAIKELIEKGYCALQYDDFSENFVNVHPSYFPDLIGKEGKVVRKIKEALGVEINFPPTQKNAPSSKKYKVGLAGTAQAVEQAKAVINNIMMYSHDALTHPDEVHAELEIEPWAWRYIIGTGGSEMRHIQNNYKVKVAIPREHSLNQKVLVVGEQLMVERAQAYIEKMVWNAEHRTSGRDKVDDGDAWGDEEPEEEWMKQYLYKR